MALSKGTKTAIIITSAVCAFLAAVIVVVTVVVPLARVAWQNSPASSFGEVSEIISVIESEQNSSANSENIISDKQESSMGQKTESEERPASSNVTPTTSQSSQPQGSSSQTPEKPKEWNIYFSSPQDKITPYNEKSETAKENYTIYLPKASSEGCQISIMSKNKSRSNLSIEVPNNYSKDLTVEVFHERYVTCGEDEFPDPLLPNELSFDLQKGKNITYLINVITNTSTKSGAYSIPVILKENGKAFAEYKITVNVWDFTLKPIDYIDTAFGLNQGYFHMVDDSVDSSTMYKKYYDVMLNRYGICAYSLPYDILDPRADEYMNNPRVSAFIVPNYNLQAYYNKLKTNPKWLDKSYFYLVDEPMYMSDYNRLSSMVNNIKNVFPRPNVMVPYYENYPVDGDGRTSYQIMQNDCTVWCPKINLQIYEDMNTFMKNEKANGDKYWWYCCWGPDEPYCNLLIDMDSQYHRLMLWQQYLYDVEGFLYWAINNWRSGNPWDTTVTIPEISATAYGDGSLLYPGNRVGIDGPVASLRLQVWYYGTQDYYMFQMAEAAFGGDYVDEQIKRVTNKVYKYSDDKNNIEKVRIEIGNKLSEYYN